MDNRRTMPTDMRGLVRYTAALGLQRLLTVRWISVHREGATRVMIVCLRTGQTITMPAGEVWLTTMCARCEERSPESPGRDDFRGKFCHMCSTRCHNATEFDHECAVCIDEDEIR